MCPTPFGHSAWSLSHSTTQFANFAAVNQAFFEALTENFGTPKGLLYDVEVSSPGGITGSRRPASSTRRHHSASTPAG
jgi:hypothetical protein